VPVRSLADYVITATTNATSSGGLAGGRS
jgi:hypothetical protein